MAKTPEDTALAAVAKAILEEQKAQEKANAAHEKYVAADTAAVRAHKTTKWTASHPDLPDDFDLDTFRAETLEPFDEAESESDTEENQDETDVLPGVVDPADELTEEAQLEVPDDASAIDDPFGDDELTVTLAPKARSRR